MIEPSGKIFVVGPSRSGTTWMQCMLAVQPDFYTLPETKFYQYVLSEHTDLLKNEMYPRRHRELPLEISEKQLEISLTHLYSLKFLDSNDEIISYLRRKIKIEGLSRGEFFYHLTEFVKKKWDISGKILVEGSPRHSLFYKEIINDFPDARFIIMERDAVDCALSAKYSYNYPFLQGIKDSYYLKEANHELFRDHPERVIDIVNYNDLYRNADFVMNNIFNKLGVPNIPKSKLSKDAKDIYHYIHRFYFVNNHQPKMEGKPVEKRILPSALSIIVDNFINVLLSKIRDSICRITR